MNLFNDFIEYKLKKNIGLLNMTDDFFGVYLKSLLDNYDKNILVVLDSLYDANRLYNTISDLDDNIFLFPMDDFLTSEALAISPDMMLKRLETINNIIKNEDKLIIITNLMGYLRFLPTKKNYIESIINLKIGDSIEPKRLEKKIKNIGYKRDTIVNKTGEYAIRGFIIDVFPIDEENPIRIEFFDDEIESIRYYDADTQMTISKIDRVVIKPFSEFIVNNKDISEEHYGKQKYLQFYDETANIEKYLDNSITVFKDYNQLKNSYNNLYNEMEIYKKEKDFQFSLEYMNNFNNMVSPYPIYYYSIDNYFDYDHVSNMIDFNVKTIDKFNEDQRKINDYINNCIRDNKTIIICIKNYQKRSLLKILNMKVIETTIDNIIINSVNIIEKNINHGFIYKDLILITSYELFNINNKKYNYKTKYKYSSSITDINKLNVGDYIVHNVHGIGIYNGIKTLSNNNVVKDYLEILYQGKDKIYIPVEKIELISKYSGREGTSPKINKLGGSDWIRTKRRVKSKINDIAQELIKLYAERESMKGFAFSKDCEMLVDFENAFNYDLTVDQKKAIIQIKEDMEKPIPMDRLLCGDVGFGKTEVAFVAAFKAILDSKQVLFLCPTTILSNQHYENALERFKSFPVNIALLNRFTSLKETNSIINGLKDGTIDMVIGTHRLLSDDVCVKNLGLLIIDEEQRFGVIHKEKIKKYKSNVDVLTLTATPIPRTLQMSLVGIRSLSLISTPPVNRFPIQTYVVEFNDLILKDAIYKELSRKGQIFILYNKVQSIEDFATKVSRILGNVKIAIAHGQMTKTKLEKTIYDFINHEYDILICTTIIEIGIDIPNVNTLIIIDADKFGLSQLYQIRGRVGRSDKFAYAYLMYEPHKILTETAIKRLNVIKEFTELGSGFSIATRDLSIRGAGDILGSEQAGFIDSVGIDLYLKMLNDEINCKNKNSSEYSEEELDEKKSLINVSTHISDDYVYEDELKIEIHKKINSIDSFKKLESVKKELEDRFGKLDESIIIYMYEELFEKIAKTLKINIVNQNKNSIELIIEPYLLNIVNSETLFMIAYEISPMFRFIGRGSRLIIVLDTIKLDTHPIYYLVNLLSKVYDIFVKSID